MPDDLKSIIVHLREKHPQEFGITKTNADQVTDKPLYVRDNSLNAMLMKSANIKPVIQYNAPAAPGADILGSGEPTTKNETSTSRPIQTETDIQTPKSPAPEFGNVEYQTPGIPLAQVPAPVMPIAIPMYPRMPIIVPAKTYFEPVKHDHPPLYKIREMIERDEKKWTKENKGKDCDSVSLELAYSDADSSTSTDTESESRNMDVGSEYYDGFMKITI
ncbi:hypothetical protein HF086_013890 [Spodoptera exigua]|uniref:Uncharacterized protein n=1 Tax=Spodoptera exigua TaxID=7107 RepID=A0A922MIK0_SPOEX|nr:hypothetical protein HF086_013890 [Spodoptera exigua]